jgi:hypothetical protein
MARLAIIPRGITKTYIKGRTYYRVRFMVDGARINLGTFSSLPLAVTAMNDWKIKDMLRAAGNLPSEQTVVEEAIKEVTASHYGELQTDEWFSKLDELPSAILSPSFDAVANDGTIIPKLMVSRYLNKLYGTLNSQDGKE